MRASWATRTGAVLARAALTDIVHSGDTVNTAARVEAQCRPLDRRVLVSEALLSRCQLPAELEVEDMGERELRGKAEAVRLFSVRARARADR